VGGRFIKRPLTVLVGKETLDALGKGGDPLP
jgi:hypothetical protein